MQDKRRSEFYAQFQTSEADELKEYADVIRSHIASAAESIVRAGIVLLAVKERLLYGEWLQWLDVEFNMSATTARRYMRVASWLGPQIDELPEGFQAEARALYLLTKRNVSDAARADAVQVLVDGGPLTAEIARGIVKAIERKAERDQRLQGAPDAVRELALAHEVDPDVVPLLIKIEKQMPDRFAQLYATDAIDTADGGQIMLSEANARDVRDWIQHERFERDMRRWEIARAERIEPHANGDGVRRWVLGGMTCMEQLSEVVAEEPTLAAVWLAPVNADDVLATIRHRGGQPLLVLAAYGDPAIAVDERRAIKASALREEIPAWLERILDEALPKDKPSV